MGNIKYTTERDSRVNELEIIITQSHKKYKRNWVDHLVLYKPDRNYNAEKIRLGFGFEYSVVLIHN